MNLDLSKLWTLLPTQEKYLKAISECKPNEMRSVAYVGALGSGKSWALCRAAIGLALSYPRMRILLGRHHSTDLRDTTKITFFELITELEDHIRDQYPPEVREQVPSIGEMHKADNEYEFSNGSVILFRPLDEAESKYKSLNIAAVGIDEASEVDLEAVQMLMGRRRQMGYPLLLFVVSNPTGYTHWLYKWFVKEQEANYFLYKTNSFENQKHLPPSYIQELSRKYSIDWVKRYIEGEWGGLTEGIPIFAGMFDTKVHIGEGRFYGGNPIWVGIDFGYGSPGVVWAHPDRQFRCQIVREWLPKEMDTYRLAEGILKRNGVWFPNAKFQYFCGHDGNQHAPSAEKTGIEILMDAGMDPSWRYHHLEAAFTVIRNMLKVRTDNTPNLIVDPHAAIVAEGFMGEYKYKPDSEKPLKNDIHDPVMDAFRYIAYQNYTLSGDHMRGESRIQMFGRKDQQDGDEHDGTVGRARRFESRGWTTTIHEQPQPIRGTERWSTGTRK